MTTTGISVPTGDIYCHYSFIFGIGMGALEVVWRTRNFVYGFTLRVCVSLHMWPVPVFCSLHCFAL